MNIFFDYFERKEIPTLLLCNPYRDPLYSLGGAYNINNVLRFNAISSLEFDFPKSMNNGETEFEVYDKIQTKMVVYVEDIGYYIITECPEDTTGMIPVKHISCQSLESELMYKRITGFSGTFNLYNSATPQNTIVGIVLRALPTWTLEYIDADLVNKYRTFDVKNNTIYNFLINDVSTAYNCVFVFNTLTRAISIYSIPNLGENTGIYFSFNNISKQVNLTEYSDEMTTALYCYGGNDLDIHYVNPLGSNVIYNFDYYKTTQWMNQDLIDALTAWENNVNSLQGIYANHITTRNIHIDTVIDSKSLAEDLKNNLAALQVTVEGLIAANASASSIEEAETKVLNQKTLINAENKKTATYQNLIDEEDGYLREIVNSLKFTQNKVWESFCGDVSSMLASITRMSADWKATYFSTNDNPEIDSAQLTQVASSIDEKFNILREELSNLYVYGNYNANMYWEITQTNIDTATSIMSNAIVSLNDLFLLFSSLLSNTSQTVSLNTYKKKLQSYFNILNFRSNFTKEQYLKLQSFIFENTYTNNHLIITDQFTDKDIQNESQALYNQSSDVLERVSRPRYEFSGEFINIFNLPEYNTYINAMELGKVINIELANEEVIEAVLLEIDYTYDKPDSLGLTLSNRIKLNNSNFRFADLFIGSSSDAGGLSGITGGTSSQITTITSSSSLFGTNLLAVPNATISKLGYISFGPEPPTEFGNTIGAWLGYTEGAKFSLYSSASDYLQWDGTRLLVKARNFTLDSAGNITANNADLSGKISAAEGDIAGWLITSGCLTSGTGNKTISLSTTGSPAIYAGGENPETAPFRIYNDGSLFATGASISGSIKATSGCIAGWVLTSTCIVDSSGTTGLNSVMTVDDDVRIWAGGVSPSTAPFMVTEGGSVFATSGSIGGNKIYSTGITSPNYWPSFRGWAISTNGNAEFENIIVRGAIKSSVFIKDTISAINGTVIITKSSLIAEDMTELDSALLKTDASTTFELNEVVRIKDGMDDEWLLITDVSDAPDNYGVTRDLAGAYAANNNPTWKVGTAVVSMGSTTTNTGFIKLDSSGCPLIDIYSRNSTTYNDYNLKVRLGNLKGITDSSVGLNDTGIWGLYTDNAYLKGTIVSTTGSIGGWVIHNNNLSSGSIFINSASPAIMMGDATGSLVGTGIFMGKNPANNYAFRIGNPATSYEIWDGDSLNFYNTSLELSGSSTFISIGYYPVSGIGGSSSGCGIWITKDGFYSIKSGCANLAVSQYGLNILTPHTIAADLGTPKENQITYRSYTGSIVGIIECAVANAITDVTRRAGFYMRAGNAAARSSPNWTDSILSLTSSGCVAASAGIAASSGISGSLQSSLNLTPHNRTAQISVGDYDAPYYNNTMVNLFSVTTNGISIESIITGSNSGSYVPNLYVSGSTTISGSMHIGTNLYTNTLSGSSHKIDGYGGVTLFADGGADVLTAGDKVVTRVPYKCYVEDFKIYSADGTSGTISGSLVKYHYASFPSTGGSTVGYFTLSSTTKGSASPVTTTVAQLQADEILKLNIWGTPTSIKKLAVSLKVRKN